MLNGMHKTIMNITPLNSIEHSEFHRTCRIDKHSICQVLAVRFYFTNLSDKYVVVLLPLKNGIYNEMESNGTAAVCRRPQREFVHKGLRYIFPSHCCLSSVVNNNNQYVIDFDFVPF